MDEEQYILNRLDEECKEVGHECSKAMNFGLDSFNPDDPYKITNRTKITNELNDIMGVVEIMIDLKIIDEDWFDEMKVAHKKAKVLKLSQVSIDRGRLDTGSFECGESNSPSVSSMITKWGLENNKTIEQNDLDTIDIIEFDTTGGRLEALRQGNYLKVLYNSK
mgnify:CR=1 FL=1